MKRSWGAIAALFLMSTAAGAGQAADRWMGAFGSPPIAYEPKIRDALGRPFSNETVRQTVRAGIAGQSIRIRLTNELSDMPLRIGGASIARIGPDGKIVPGTLRQLTFGGARSVEIPANAPYYTDAVRMPVKAGEELAVSLFYPDKAEPHAHAQMVDIAGPGDLTTRDAFAGARRARAPGIVSAVEVSGAEATRVLVAFGDSITEGAGATPGRHMSWPDQLGRMLAASPTGRCWSIVNAGISGNRLLHDGRGPNALARFDRDALSVPGVTNIALLEGINDIGRISDPAKLDQVVTADQIIDAYRQILARAHAKGVKLIIGTLLPYEGAAYADAEGEAKRTTVNRWIRANSDRFDGVIEFDAAMQEPGRPKVMRLAEQIGDHLHPNDQGYTRMARAAFPVISKERCPSATRR